MAHGWITEANRDRASAGVPAQAIVHRALFPQAWPWTLASGVADGMFAVIIIGGWPGSVASALGLLVGINLFLAGPALVMTAIACGCVDHTPGPRAMAGRAA
ncbi:hypothetical protein [Bradyrhizobium sp. CCGUVB23]|uniref:hypothetical protein n=1 Tax=Bradyrhizobium sp. CCGUVB23 TaxID=2949630 RepID=UPI0020B3D5D5|nr:hypothetical protein [Bradyrhizobium sp. CCGUVB23]MCP3465620.1 hypothetical protein [Bradyrhizobium sp. CCGUVB23]